MTSEFILLTNKPMALDCAEKPWLWAIYEKYYHPEIEIKQVLLRVQESLAFASSSSDSKTG